MKHTKVINHRALTLIEVLLLAVVASAPFFLSTWLHERFKVSGFVAIPASFISVWGAYALVAYRVHRREKP